MYYTKKSWMFLFRFVLILYHSLCCPNNGQISVYLPRNQKSVIADVKVIDGILVAIVNDMILGDVYCKQSDDGSFTQHVELKGDFALTNAITIDGLDDRKLDLIVKPDSTRWPHSVVYYQIGGGFPSVIVDAIHNAVWSWTHNSPIRFIESSTAQDRIKVTSNHGYCLANVGRKGGVQHLSLDANGLCNIGQIIHELGHSIGWNHEHLRPDRDSYITVKDENILMGYMDSYEMVFDHHYGAHQYDYASVMHYPPQGFTNNGENIIEAVEKPFQSFQESYPNELPMREIGQRYFLSTIDKQMSYTYLTKCITEGQWSSLDNLNPKWEVAPWGGCNPQCDGPSFRERLVSCRFKGICLEEKKCDASSKPLARKSCELAPGNLNVTFDEVNWWEVRGMMQNVAMYDQFEWNVWSGNPAGISDSGETFTGERTAGPGGDASTKEDGRYLWFSSWAPLKKGDQAWFESPVLGTTNNQSCEVSFHWFIVGSGAKLQVELVSCEDCWDVMIMWSTVHSEALWSTTALVIPPISTSKVRLRFVGIRHRSRNGNIGIDNIVFSEGCIREDLEEVVATLNADDAANTMVYPYTLDPYCIYINKSGSTTLTLLEVMGLLIASSVISICCCGITEYKVRKFKLMQMIDSTPPGALDSVQVRRASSVVQRMNPWYFTTIIQKENFDRVNSVTNLARAAHFTQNAGDSFRILYKDPHRPLPKFGHHRNKSLDKSSNTGSAFGVENRFLPQRREDFTPSLKHPKLQVASNYTGRIDDIRESITGHKREHSGIRESIAESVQSITDFAKETGFTSRIQSIGKYKQTSMKKKEKSRNSVLQSDSCCGSVDSSLRAVRKKMDIDEMIDSGLHLRSTSNTDNQQWLRTSFLGSLCEDERNSFCLDSSYECGRDSLLSSTHEQKVVID